ncbi:helix-turn-helix domain-containing protein [Gracilibacillus xinjiangensis]|uniref:Helix-turn-helix domain-containing protein n=1 Tax=Gracilibacillus xinjiangensis TaxID=1193282 RepID=A0ABV8WY96_9BACI
MFHYGKLIRNYRRRKQMTQKKLALESDCSDSYISKIEAGKAEPQEELLTKISVILDIKELQGNYTTYPPFDKKLDEWHNAITEHKRPVADKLYNELKTHFPLQRIEFNTRYYIFLFRYFLLRFDLPQAKPILPKIVEYTNTLNEKESYLCYKSLGYYFILENDLKNALYYLQSARNVKNSPVQDDPEIHIYFALIHIHSDNPIHAGKELQKAYQLYDKRIDSINLLLCKYLLTIPDIMLQKYEDAIRSLNKILEQSFHQAFQIKREWIHFTLGYIYLKLREYNKALHALREAIIKEEVPIYKVMYVYFIAIVYACNGQKQQCMDYIHTGRKLKVNKKYQHRLYLLKQIITSNLYSTHTLQYLENHMLPYFTSKGDQIQRDECHLMIAAIYNKSFQYKKANSHLRYVVRNFQLAELSEMYTI